MKVITLILFVTWLVTAYAFVSAVVTSYLAYEAHFTIKGRNKMALERMKGVNTRFLWKRWWCYTLVCLLSLSFQYGWVYF